MSGTSLDGVDLAYCEFIQENKKWEFNLKSAKTIPYSQDWKIRFRELIHANALDYVKTHVELGRYFGKLLNDFIAKYNLKPDFISSHGHTVFHQPKRKKGSPQFAVDKSEKEEFGFTSQIGDGASISALTGCPVVCDFRSGDVALNGQGAPLVPVGDHLLFREYDYCLNLGGIANISFLSKNGERIAFDICPVNMSLNYLANQKSLEYDKDGIIASSGKINVELFNRLNNLPYYSMPFPKSMGVEWFNKEFLPLLKNDTVENSMRTVVEHIAFQIIETTRKTKADKKQKLLITGGGAHNSFLIQQIKNQSGPEIIIPSKEIVDYKEAILFAFLGVLRMLEEENILSSVTGASENSCGGAIYNAKLKEKK